eukprot:TRINITY_DN3818_c0_g1_i5.p1 TRINITY_DN3818_c0_g1~~TRINITY_DN3818_c0_g1_i5.p1  ORF type:complete len:809 (+),score=98.90 TRINITY_DN3818_c0_g1_i5:54-2480(+)
MNNNVEYRVAVALSTRSEKIAISDEERGQMPDAFIRYTFADKELLSPNEILALEKKLFDDRNRTIDLRKLSKYCVGKHSHFDTEYKRQVTESEKDFYTEVCTNIKKCALVCSSRGILASEDVVREAKESKVFPAGVLSKVMELYSDPTETSSIITFMLAVSYLERLLSEIVVFSLGDTVTVRDVKITDVLQSAAITTCFGKELVLVLRAMIGPLNGLQLRNTTWHNFVNAHEWEKPYTDLLLSMIVSIAVSTNYFVLNSFGSQIPLSCMLKQIRMSESCQHLHQKQYLDALFKLKANSLRSARFALPKKRKRRKLPRLTPIRLQTTSFITPIDDSESVSPLQMADSRARSHRGGPLLDFKLWHSQMRDRFGICLLSSDICMLTFIKRSRANITTHFQTSPLILKSREPQWLQAMDYILSNKWYEAATLITTLTESCLRLLFSSLTNHHCKWQCPLSDDLFVVIDDILGHQLVHEAIPSGVLNIFFDHWVWKEGVRIRDDIAHGSCHPDMLSEEAVVPIFIAALQMCKTFPQQCLQLQKDPQEEEVERFVLEYKPQLSPWALLHKEFAECMTSVRNMAATSAVIIERGTGFPEPVGESSIVKDFSHKNQRREDDPNDLPAHDTIKTLIDQLCRNIPFVDANTTGMPTVRYVTSVLSMVLEEMLKSQHPDIRDLPFVGKVSNCSTKRISELTVLRKTISSIYRFNNRIIETYINSYQGIISRRAYAKQRVAYARLIADFDTLFLMSAAGLVFVASNYFTHFSKNGDLLRETCLNFVHSMLHQAELKQWYRCLPEFNNFVALVNKQGCTDS